jgi:acetyl esterase/lipase
MNRFKIRLLLGMILAGALALGLRPVVSQNTAPPQTNTGQTETPQLSAMQTEKDVVYGEVDGQELLLDVYRPGGAPKTRPAVVLVHGGGWSAGSKNDFGDLAAGLTRAGYVSFSVGYRLVTAARNKYPAQIDDVQRAVRWIRAHSERYGVDPKRIGALGASAGGHLVALLGTRDTRDNSDPELAAYSSRVNCVIDIFGPTDFTGPKAGLSPDAHAIVLNFFGQSPEEAPALYRDASPITHIDQKTVPFLIFHGTADPLVPIDQSQRFYDALRTAKIEATFIPFEGEGHGFVKKENQDRFLQEGLAFLNRHLKP